MVAATVAFALAACGPVVGTALSSNRVAMTLGAATLHRATQPVAPATTAHGRSHVAPGAPRTPDSAPAGMAPTAAPAAAGPADGPVVVMQNGQLPSGITACGISLCNGGTPWVMNGATIYNPGLRPEQSGFLNPQGTVALAQQANLNTLRIINFYPENGDPNSEPYDATEWGHVDQMINDAEAAGLHVDLGLADYRNTLWNDCINPYTYDWTRYIDWVAHRVNTVTGAVYGSDPAIAFVSISGEPLPTGSYTFTARTTGQSCTLSYTTQNLTNFYANAENEWVATGATTMVNSGGLGYINEYQSAGIDWKSIYALPHNALCGFKTYGGMLAFAPTVAQYCHSIGKPIVDEEFGFQQSDGDATRASEMTNTYTQLKAIGIAGVAFWNLGYQVAATSYDISPATPLVFAAVQAAGL